MEGKVLILEDEKSVHLEFLQSHLKCEPLVINVGKIGNGLTYEFNSSDTTPIVSYEGEVLDVRPGAIKSVWYREVRVEQLSPNLTVDTEQREYAISSLQHQADSLLALIPEDTFWVSNRGAIQRAEQKPLQLRAAREAGFNVPATIFATNSAQAAAFMRRHGACVIKPMAKCAPAGQNQYTVVRDIEALNFQGLEVNPHIFQAAIEPAFEVRAAVIGKQVFAAIVADSNANQAAEQGYRDFRHAFDEGTFEAESYTLPEAIVHSCVDLVHRLGTVCGFIDLIFDRNGTCWFLEDNPNGQWAFVDDITVDFIAEALAQLLATGKVE